MAQGNDSTHNSPEKKGKSTPFLRNKRLQQKHYDWLSGPHNPTRGEMALWVAVITQAMQDALSRSGNAEALYHKHEAIHWLTSNSRDFVTVCLFAGMDPDYVRRMAKRALANPGAWRAAAGKGDRYLERKEYRKKLKENRKALLTKASPAMEPITLIFPSITA